jgi:protoporphyrinogen oxidase
LIGLGASALWLPALAADGSGRKAPPLAKSRDADIGAISPIDRLLPDGVLGRYTGDDHAGAHGALRDRPALAAVPEPSERIPLAIVGGGVSGLAGAWWLRKHHPVILERAARFGGNSRGESWRGVDYAIGAAYFVKPEKGRPADRLIRELGIAGLCKEHRGKAVVLDGVRHSAFWKGATAPAEKARFAQLARHFHDVLNRKNGWFYPEIPVEDARLRGRIDELDRLTFLRHLENVAGGRLHPHIETAIEHYCWSSFGASAREVSAACGLNFYAAEFDTLMVAPGGNAAVAEALVQRLARELPPSSLRAGATVLDVRVRDDGVQLTYADAAGGLKSLLARAAIMACPKFVVARVLRGIEDEPQRVAAIRELRYNAYLVANVLLRGPVKHDFYDLFLLGPGATGNDIELAADRQRATDVILATYARPRQDRTVLTLYRAFPYAGAGGGTRGRARIIADEANPNFRAEFEAQVEREILPLVARRASDIVDVRVARWGHPLPVARAGLIADRVPERLREPFRRRVFFVEQDNWALPSFETAVGEAWHFAPQVAKALAS